MGKPTSNEDLPPYRDDPSMDDALSMHTTQGEQDDVPEFSAAHSLAAPPRYSDSEPELPNIEDNPYANGPEGVVWKANSGKINVCHPAYDKNPVYLRECIRRWAREPPAIHVQILGTHNQKTKKGDKTENEKVVDFDMKLRLTEYFFTDTNYSRWTETIVVDDSIKTYRGTVLKSRGVNPPEGLERAPPTMADWCEDYCESKATLKRYVFTQLASSANSYLLFRDSISPVKSADWTKNCFQKTSRA